MIGRFLLMLLFFLCNIHFLLLEHLVVDVKAVYDWTDLR